MKEERVNLQQLVKAKTIEERIKLLTDELETNNGKGTCANAKAIKMVIGDMELAKQSESYLKKLGEEETRRFNAEMNEAKLEVQLAEAKDENKLNKQAGWLLAGLFALACIFLLMLRV
jgi:hypothetical protein